jgi:aspartate-semialdehyde dehydrogenase
MALAPLHRYSRIRRVVASSYQAVSGAGAKALDEFAQQVRAWAKGEPLPVTVFPYQIAFNVLPHIDVFLENGYTKEEMKLVNESRKILEDDAILISPTTVRVPVFTAHSVSVHVETEKKITAAKARELFAAGTDDCYVGRIREDLAVANGLNFWVVGDQLRKGAALNAVQIAEHLIEKYL